MPELPEVETTLRGIAPHILNQTVSAVTVRQPKLRWQIPPALPETLRDLCKIPSPSQQPKPK